MMNRFVLGITGIAAEKLSLRRIKKSSTGLGFDGQEGRWKAANGTECATFYLCFLLTKFEKGNLMIESCPTDAMVAYTLIKMLRDNKF